MRPRQGIPERRNLTCMKDVPKTLEAVWKIESTGLNAAIARVPHDIGIAEELGKLELSHGCPSRGAYL
jgi:hypothetical protein